MDSSEILDIGGEKGARRLVDPDAAFEAELRGPVRETGDRDMVAEAIPCRGESTRLGSDFDLEFEHLLIVVVARAQHHPVRAERHR